MGAQLAMAFNEDDGVGYRGPTVCKIVGVTYRQLDYWTRTELVTPSIRGADGSGTQRLYSFDDIVAIRVVKRLLDTGVSLQKVRQSIDALREQGRGLSDSTLVSDGTRVFEVDGDDAIIDLLKKGQGVFAIAVAPVVSELRGEVTAFPSERIDDVTALAAAEPATTPATDASKHGDPAAV
jgi:DNA-binding transcriptional MerR regulator